MPDDTAAENAKAAGTVTDEIAQAEKQRIGIDRDGEGAGGAGGTAADNRPAGPQDDPASVEAIRRTSDTDRRV